jgi:hypothetical protein
VTVHLLSVPVHSPRARYSNMTENTWGILGARSQWAARSPQPRTGWDALRPGKVSQADTDH